MTSRTFCLLLAAFLFALSAGTALIMRGMQREDGTIQDAFVAVLPEERLKSPAGNWQRASVFGAQYSEQYGQWSFRDDILLEMADSAPVYAPMSGKVIRIEAIEQGGSRAVLRCRDEIEISLHPVYSLRVFEGSAVEQGDVIGEGRGSVSMKTWQAGCVIDPLTLAEY